MNSNPSSKVNKPKKESNFFFDFVKVTGALPVLIWLRPKFIHISGKKPPKYKKGILVASNHVSFSDPVMLLTAFWYRRLNCIATKDLEHNAFLKFFFRHVHCIMIDKNNFSVGSMKQAVSRLKQDKAVAIFPEGTVSRTEDELLTFKSGAVMMAYLAKKPILPVYMPKLKHKLSRRIMVFGDPFDVVEFLGKGANKEKIQQASEILHQKEEELKYYYENVYLKKKK